MFFRGQNVCHYQVEEAPRAAGFLDEQADSGLARDRQVRGSAGLTANLGNEFAVCLPAGQAAGKPPAILRQRAPAATVHGVR